MFRWHQRIPAVFSREEFLHPVGLLCSPQRLPAVWTGRLDPGEDGASGAAQGPQAETRGPRQSGRGPPETAHTQTLQLNKLHVEVKTGATQTLFLQINIQKVTFKRKKVTDTVLLMQFFNILLVSTLRTILR